MAEAIAPPPKLKASEWAEEHRIVSGKAAAMPGKWRNINAPHLVEPMDTVSDPDIHTVTYMAGTQDGKTELSLNAVG
ncbi:MAG: phage terminase large subunit family protein, partial [Rhodospirillales bacterium]|nr:phage terminase large subunit family protein [Rhodospirillales bacterium]